MRATRRRALGLLGLAAAAPLLAAEGGTPGEVRTGEVLREAALDGLNGPPRKLSAYRGRPLLINVWASWCGPCRAEMASLERLAWMEAASGLSLIGISTDDHRDRALAFLKLSNATISHFIDHRLELEHMLGAARLPLTVLVDRDGRVKGKIFGARPWDSAESLALIRRAIAPAGGPPARRA